MRTRDSPGQIMGAVATVVNFPVVFAGFLIIVWQTDGNDEIALLNLWSSWGILLGLLGQVGLISGVMDRLGSGAAVVRRNAVIFAALAAAVAFAFRSKLFPEHELWWIAVGIIAAATYVIGRLRAEFTLGKDSITAVVIAAVENVARTLLVLILVVAGSASLGVLAIVLPFFLSLALLQMRSPIANPAWEEPARVMPSAIAPGVLAGVPALGAYSVVPVLSVLELTDDLDRIAIASALLRGPLLAAAFIAPWILEQLSGGHSDDFRWLAVVPPPMVAAGVLVAVTIAEGFGELILQTGLAALASGATYGLVLAFTRTQLDSRVATVAIIAGVSTFLVTLWFTADLSWSHPFIAVSAMATAITLTLSTMLDRGGYPR